MDPNSTTPLTPSNSTTALSSNNNIITITAINVISIRSIHRRYELSQFINNNNIDIALVSETKLHNTHNIKLENYEVIRTDRQGNNTTGGGTAIFIKKKYEYSHHPPQLE